MINIARWKIIAVLLACLWGVLYAAPNAMNTETRAWLTKLPSWMPSQTVNLGLDLRGGSHLMLEVDTKVVVTEFLAGLVDEARRELRAADIGYTNLSNNADSAFFTLRDNAQQDAALKIMRKLDAGLEVANVNGTITARMSEELRRSKINQAMDQSIEIVRRRIDQTGTSEPSIQRQGEDRIQVQLPGVDNPERLKNLLGQTAKLAFRFVDPNASAADAALGRLPAGTELLPSVENEKQKYVISRRVIVSGEMLTDAQPSFQNGAPVVSFKFDTVGGRRFGEATKENVGRLFAIVLDGKVISAPVIREPILGGSGVISGSFTAQQAQDLALLLRAGALPAPLTVIEERTVGPGLGADSIEAGATACLIGLGAVVVFMLVTYGLFGVFANIALAFNIALIFAVLSVLQATLTLPGIAGILLTIGMAVDANVLVYERIREEVRLGRTVIAAIDAGYNRALSAILDANVTTLIAAFLLFLFGSGPVKGFAVTLSIGILTSLFTALMVTRLIVIWWLRRFKPKSIPI